MLLLSNIRHTKEYVSAKNYTTLSPINVANLVNEILSYILAIVGEEIFFRYFLINSMTRYIGIYVIPMGGILFTLTHYLNRWANIIFNVRSYIYHTIIGLVLGGIYYLTGSICGCIISHLIFNSPELVILYKRYKVRIHEDVQLFDDYN